MTSTQSQAIKKEKATRSRYESSIQEAVEYISTMEKNLDELSSEVADMKKRLVNYAEEVSEKAKSEIVEAKTKEAEAYLASIRAGAEKEAKEILARGEAEAEALRKRIGSKIPKAVDIIVQSIIAQ